MEDINNLQKSKLTICDILIIFTILFQGANHLIIFSSPFFKYFIILLGVILLLDNIKNNREFKVNIYYLIFLMIIYLYSAIISPNIKLIVPMCFFIFEIITFKLYIKRFSTREELFRRLLKIILISSTILATIGIIQIFAYKLGIKILYDFKWIGIIPNYYGYLEEGRFYSIYDEPAHLCTIIGAGLFASYFYIKRYSKNYFVNLIIIGIFGLCTGSIVTYFSIAVFAFLILLYSFYYDRTSIATKLLTILFILFLFGIVLILNFSLFENSIIKLDNFFADNSTNVYEQNKTTFAIKSNLLIVIQKIKDGYIFGTGIFSHEFYYFDYVDMIYPNRYQKYLNYSDAASIFIRIFSEFGILGFAFLTELIIMIVKYFRKKDYIGLFYICLFITQGSRLGDYTWLFNCLPFVILLNDNFLKNNNLKKFNRSLIWKRN